MGHTWEPCFGHFNIPPHFNTYARGPLQGLEVFRCLEELLPYKTLIRGPGSSTPLDVIMKGVARWIFLLVLCLVGLYDNSKPCLGTSCDMIQPGFTETGSSRPIKLQDIRF